jgi:hypothetical protein
VHPAANPLRRARLQRGLSLSEIAARTLLSPRIVQVLDEGRFSDLPGGVYGRSYVRAYALVVDLDPSSALAELEPYLPAPEDPFPALRALARAREPEWLIAVQDAARSLVRAMAQNPALGLSARGIPRKLGEATAAALLLMLVLLGLIHLTALICGVDTGALLRHSGAPLAAMWGFFVSSYLGVSRLRSLRAGVIVRIPR